MYSDNDFFGLDLGGASGEAHLTRSYTSTGEVANLGFSFAVVNSEQSPYEDHALQGHTYSPATGLLTSVGRTDWGALGGLHDRSVAFGRDAAGRVSGWSHGAVGGVSLDALQTPDGIGRTKKVETTVAGAPGSFTEYSYSNGQRQTADTDRGKWAYYYNGRGEVLSGTKGIGNTVVPGYRFGYSYDAIGNLTSREVNYRTATYTTNSLNQYTQRTVPSFLDVRGWRSGATAGSTAEVQLLSTAGQALSDWVDARPFVGGYFAANVPLDNTAGPRIVNVEVRSTAMVGQPAQEVEVKETRRATLAKTPEVMGYDGDGNLVSDGLWAYAWDAQNRLQWAVRQAGTAGAGDATLVHYAYDHLGRRVGKIVYVSGAAMPLVKSKTIYFYDGWNLIYETKITPGNGAVPDTRLTRQYTWGLDMSGTPQGAGGVGGLVGVSLVEAIRDAPGLDAAHLGWRILQDTSLVPAYDGNGNIVAYRNAATGAVEQEEEYGPFGESLRPRPESALRSPFGWSTKYTEEETGLVYYGHRYYSPSLARWVNRDPIEEEGGENLYAMIGNDPVNHWDLLGLLCPVRLEIDGVPNGTVYKAAKSYPVFDENLYVVPVYALTVKSSTSGKQTTFGVIRFMPYLNPKNGQDKRYKYIKNTVDMIGLGESKTYIIKQYKDYHLHSTTSGDNGAFVLEGTHYIHDGPDDDNQVFGGAGCLEIFGPNGMEELKKIVAEYSGSTKNSIEEKLKELTKAGMLRAVLKAASKPAVQLSPLKLAP